jgi:hypothetical protein
MRDEVWRVSIDNGEYYRLRLVVEVVEIGGGGGGQFEID